MISMVPGSWYQRQPQVPGLSLAQAANPQLQTLPSYPQPQPQVPFALTTLPSMPQPAPAPTLSTLPSLPQGKPYGGLDYAEFGYYDDQALEDAFHLEADPERSKRMMLELTRRRAAQFEMAPPLGDPAFEQKTLEGSYAGASPKANYGAWPQEPAPVLPDSIQQNPYETQRGTPSDGDLNALIASIFGGGSGAAGAGIVPTGLDIPGLPARPEASQAPDFGPFPEAPVLSAPDFSRANEYFEAAKPKPYEADQQEMGLAVLAGALGGFSPYGSVGEILGRMAGPGIGSGFSQHKEDKALSREADRDLQAWNAAMGQQATSQEMATQDVENLNAQNTYQNALAQYQDAQNRYQMAREEDRWQASYDLQRAAAELERAQMQMMAPYYQSRAAYYAGGGSRGGSGLSMGSVLKTIHDGVNQGALPGIEGMNQQLEATKQAMLAAAQNDPNRLALYMTDPKQLDLDARRALTEQIFQLAQQDQQLMYELMLASMKGKTGMGIEDVLMGLSE